MTRITGDTIDVNAKDFQIEAVKKHENVYSLQNPFLFAYNQMYASDMYSLMVPHSSIAQGSYLNQQSAFLSEAYGTVLAFRAIYDAQNRYFAIFLKYLCRFYCCAVSPNVLRTIMQFM